MALFKFTQAILDSKPINVFNHGEMYRDFTYVEDLVRCDSEADDCSSRFRGREDSR